MKTMKCDRCEHTTDGETFEAWMESMKGHYMETHADVMKNDKGMTPEEQKAEQMKWMVENKKRFEDA